MNRKMLFRLFKLSLAFVLFSPIVSFAKSPVTIDPCDLLTHQEVDKIMGEKMKEGKLDEQKITGTKRCFYQARNVNSFSLLQISIVEGKKAKEYFSVIKKGFPDHEVIEGVGDDAFIATPGIHILTKSYYITIAAGNINKNKDKALAAGKKVVYNLKKREQ